ncbi:MAG: hypothetical protein WC553_03150 [Patescibacteria group bacterium]|jgi:hypothetical protein
MNCYKHSLERAVGMCSQGCGRGLCRECSERFGQPICEHCYTTMAGEYQDALATERGAIIRQLVISGSVLGTLLIGIIALVAVASASTGEPPHGAAFISLLVIPTIIWSFVNFRKLMDKLSDITGLMYFTTVNNWIIIFICGIVLVAPFAFIILPINIIMDIKRLRELN